MESWELNNSNATNHTILVLLVTKLEVTKNLVTFPTYAKSGHFLKVWKILFFYSKGSKAIVFQMIPYLIILSGTSVFLLIIKYIEWLWILENTTFRAFWIKNKIFHTFEKWPILA